MIHFRRKIKIKENGREWNEESINKDEKHQGR
jgi:hypothetical protein